VGYIDPGVNPDPQLHWMAKINCPNKTKDQNLIAFQLAGQIYYRVKENILWGEELLVWYGKPYAEKMGINLETVEQFTRKEDHTKEASVCEYCHVGMEGERELQEHLGKGGGHVYKCGVKQAKEMVRMAESGERRFVCKVCGKGFKTNWSLMLHNSVHFIPSRRHLCVMWKDVTRPTQQRYIFFKRYHFFTLQQVFGYQFLTLCSKKFARLRRTNFNHRLFF
jgi:hypothetical protein